MQPWVVRGLRFEYMKLEQNIDNVLVKKGIEKYNNIGNKSDE